MESTTHSGKNTVEELGALLRRHAIDTTRLVSDNAAMRAALDKAQRDAETYKMRYRNHAETLRGVRDLCKKNDIQAAILWCTDGLTGYTEPIESSLLQFQDENNALRAQVEKLEKVRVAAANYVRVADSNHPGYAAYRAAVEALDAALTECADD
jgi:hypothetical protein